MVEYRCPVCGKPVLQNFKFCKSCGARLPKDLFKKKQQHQSSSSVAHSSPVSTAPEPEKEPEIEPIDPAIVHAVR